MKMVEKLNRLIKEACGYSDEEYGSGCYNSGGSGCESSDSGYPRKRFLSDDDVYQDNGYDPDFEMPDAYADRARDFDYYNQYESLKRNRRPAKRMSESRRVARRNRKTR